MSFGRRISPLLLLLAGCGNAALHAAERGDTTRLRSEIASKHERGKLGNAEATDLARAVAEHEIESAKDEKTALARLDETRACVKELEGSLEKRMKTHDGAGALAATELYEAGKISDGGARDYLDDPDDRWRAVGARGLVREEDRQRRQALIVDPSPTVRRAAIKAAAKAKDPSDIDLLFETVRVDPELMQRNDALRAISAIVRVKHDERAADLAVRLRDLATSGDDSIKEDVAVAWGLSPIRENGGREALRVAVAEGKGAGAIAAAGVVLRSMPKDEELVASATALLARMITDGTRPDRLHAIAVTGPKDGPILEALRKAAHDDDRDIALPALTRLLETKSDRESAKRDLLVLAGYGVKGDASDQRRVAAATRARYALAMAKDLQIQAWIEMDLKATAPQQKISAAMSLGALGRLARAAPLLADDDATVRTRAACAMLVAARVY